MNIRTSTLVVMGACALRFLGGCAADAPTNVLTVSPGESSTLAPNAAQAATPPVLVMGEGALFACGVLATGTASCWGQNSNGQLGLGDTSNRGNSNPGMAIPHVAMWPSTKAVTTLGAAGASACAVLDDDTLHCWGLNDSGQLGLGDTRDRGGVATDLGGAVPAVSLPAGVQLTAVSTGGGEHFCGLTAGGAIYCWGLNEFGQLGVGDQQNRGDSPNEMGAALPPVDLGTGHTAHAIAAGWLHTCAILNDGGVKCWGDNTYGQLGLGDTNNRGVTAASMGDSLPEINLGTGRTAVSLTMGYGHTCAQLDNGQMKCWGLNNLGQLGLGDTNNRGDLSPQQMGEALPAIELGSIYPVIGIAAGTYSTCGILHGGQLKCWGDGTDTVYDSGTVPDTMGANLPVTVMGGNYGVVSASMGYFSMCAALANGRITCWGANENGELGLGDTVGRRYPTEAGYVPF